MKKKKSTKSVEHHALADITKVEDTNIFYQLGRYDKRKVRRMNRALGLHSINRSSNMPTIRR